MIPSTVNTAHGAHHFPGALSYLKGRISIEKGLILSLSGHKALCFTISSLGLPEEYISSTRSSWKNGKVVCNEMEDTPVMLK